MKQFSIKYERITMLLQIISESNIYTRFAEIYQIGIKSNDHIEHRILLNLIT